MSEKPIIPYVTRSNYVKLQEIKLKYQMYELNNMVWDGMIYFDNLNYIKTVLKEDDFQIQKLSLPSFDHYFVIHNNADEHKPLLFWANTLETDDSPEDLRYIFTYKTDPNEFQIITVNRKRYSTIHVGNMINEYAKLKGFQLTRDIMKVFYKDFLDFVEGKKTEFKFSYSLIEQNCIIYRVRVQS